MIPEQLHLKYLTLMQPILDVMNEELGTRIEQDLRSYGHPRKLSGETFYISYKLRDMGNTETFRVLNLNVDEQEFGSLSGQGAVSASAASRAKDEIRAFWGGSNSATERSVFVPAPSAGQNP